MNQDVILKNHFRNIFCKWVCYKKSHEYKIDTGEYIEYKVHFTENKHIYLQNTCTNW